MAAGGVFDLSGDAGNRRATIIRATVDGASPVWLFGRELLLQVGKEPSRAILDLPLSQQSDTAPSVALAPFGPLSNIKPGLRVRVTATEEGQRPRNILNGSVVSVSHELAPDGAAIEVLDDKWLMEGVTVFGQWMYLPSDAFDGDVVFRHRGPCVFNPEGRPNCIDPPDGRPMFAPYPYYGWQENTYEEPAAGAAHTRARSWRIDDVLSYLWGVYYQGSDWNLSSVYDEYLQLRNDYIDWPAEYSSAIVPDTFNIYGDSETAEEIQDNDREQGVNAKAINVNLEGKNLLAALSELIEMVGEYGLYMEPEAEGWKSRITVRPKKWIPALQSMSMSLARDFSGSGRGQVGVISGNIKYDGRGAFSSVVVHGDTVMLERRVEWTPSLALDDSSQTLWPAWTRPAPGETADYDTPGQTEEERFIHLLKTAVMGSTDVSKTSKAWVQATTKYPRVFSAYKINPKWDWLSGTKASTESERVSVSPPILAHLLTGVGDDGEGVTQVLDGSLRRFASRPIVVEFYNESTYNWETADEISGVQVDDEGNIYFPALREAILSNAGFSVGSASGSLYSPDGLTPRRVRMTVAFMLDYRAKKSLRISTDDGIVTDGTADPNGEGEIASDLKRQYVASTGDAYREYLRKGSWPTPESVTGATQAEDRCTEGNELLYDGDWLAKHAQRRLAIVARTERSGILRLPCIVPWQPGIMLEAILGFYIGACVSGVKFTYRGRDTATELILS